MSLYIANASGKLDSLLRAIERVYEKAKSDVAPLLSLDIDSVDIIIVNDPIMTIPALGIGGYSPNRDLCYIYIDSQKDISEDELYFTLVHELAHVKRYDTYGYGKTLFDSIIFEGLAMALEDELSSGQAYLVQQLLNRKNTEELIKNSSIHFDEAAFNHNKWFISGDNDTLPKWAGYEMGYFIVRNYLKATNRKISEIILEDSAVFRDYVK